MDYKRVLRLHFVNHLSGREIAESCGDCSKTTVNEFLKRFRENPELSYPLPADVTNEYIEGLLYKKPGVSADQLLYRDFNKEAVYKALARKGETLKHLWQKYNAIGIVDGVFWRAIFPIFIVMIPYNQHYIFMQFCRISIHYRKIKDAFAPLSRLKSLILR